MIILGLLVVIFIGVLLQSTDYLSAFGAIPMGARLERMRRSPNYNGKRFINPVETSPGLKARTLWNTVYLWIAGREERVPHRPAPIITINPGSYRNEPPSGLRVTWMGHSTLLIEIDGQYIGND